MFLNSRERTYAVTAYIPKGKVLTYKTLAQLALVTNPRLVGSYLHKNPYEGIIPCHRVLNSQGKTAVTFAFGGGSAQMDLLCGEGVREIKGKIDLKKYLWLPSSVFKQYLSLLFRYGPPGHWPWFGDKQGHTQEEVIISSILTQHTNWRNVERVIENLRKEKYCSLRSIATLYEHKRNTLTNLIKPAGFYNQKAERLGTISTYLCHTYESLHSFFKRPTDDIRRELLGIKGLSKETVDTILLYAGNKPVFVIDAYTKRFVLAQGISQNQEYDSLQEFFQSNLPKSTELYQDYHALIVAWGKENKDQSLANKKS